MTYNFWGGHNLVHNICAAVLLEGVVVVTTALLVFTDKQHTLDSSRSGGGVAGERQSDIRDLASNTQNQLSPGKNTKGKTPLEELKAPGRALTQNPGSEGLYRRCAI